MCNYDLWHILENKEKHNILVKELAAVKSATETEIYILTNII